ncbi:MAG TPA: MinD/ParA family protein [Povalibacter sp.]|uniref:MinD/ParA family protein n=1 Tax=Povalibacter sp. TaxID=1962978 RepID=UPI002C6B49E0|nr:MinD/ParA family protein [Povalibacter sp.]HMN44415.1 MinD/ParA family protein [Povalibacter sp.]
MQTAGLRRSVHPGPVQVIAVTGGKGGVGKTSVAVNLATALATTGRRVMLLDGDLGLANVDVFLGMSPRHTMAHVLSGERSLEEIILESPHGVQVVPGASGVADMANLSEAGHLSLIQAFSALNSRVDTLIVDTSAGISHSVVQFSQAAQHVLLVVCDEPASMTDAYALVKVLSRNHGVNRFRVVANMARAPGEGDHLFEKLQRVTSKFLDVTLEYVGEIPEDPYLRRSIREQRPVIGAFPASPSTRAFKKLALKADKWPVPDGPRGNLEFFVERLVRRPQARLEVVR